MNEQPLDLKIAFRAIWRRRLWVFAITVLALAAGVAYAHETPSEPAAETIVLLPSSDVSGAGNVSPYTQTQIIIATSTPVLAAAGSAVSPPESAGALRAAVTAQGVSQDVLQIKVLASTVARAEALANAVATNYIAYVNKAASSANATVNALQQQSTALTKQFLSLQDQINKLSSQIAAEHPSSPAGQRDEALLAGLRDQQQQVSLQLNNIDTQLVNAEVSRAQNAGATKVLQKAEPVPQPGSRTAVDGLMAAGAGFVAACVLVLGLSRRDRSLRHRDAVAAVLGVPVLASLEAEPRKSTKDWARLLERYQPSPTETWNVRRVLHRLAPLDAGRRGAIALLAFSGDDAAIAACVEVAKDAAVLGMQVRVSAGAQPSLASFRAACLALQRRAGADDGSLLLTAKSTSKEFTDVVLSVALHVVDAGEPVVPGLLGPTMLALSSGFISAEPLARAALAASDAGSPIEGVLMVNPDPDDVTTGSLSVQGEPWPITRRPGPRPAADLTTGASR